MPKELIIPLNDHISIHTCVEPNPDKSRQSAVHRWNAVSLQTLKHLTVPTLS